MTWWKGKKILVTGADGFIGSHLVERLVSEEAQVRAFVFYNSFNALGWLEDVPETVRAVTEVVTGDIRDSKLVEMAVRDCEIIFHLAALIPVPYSYQAVASFVETNVLGTLNVLQAAKDHRVGLVVHTSTSEVYGTPEIIPIKENHPLQAQSPYAASKIAADKLVESFYRTYGLPTVIVRPFNTYGPRQSARAVIPTILTQLLAGCSEVKLGALEPRRDFVFVSDTVEGFVQAGQCTQAIGKVVQLGTGRDVSIGELFEMATSILGVKASVVIEEERKRPPKSEVDRLVSDVTLARTLMAWQPLVSLEVGIARTAEWFAKNLSRYKIYEYNV